MPLLRYARFYCSVLAVLCAALAFAAWRAASLNDYLVAMLAGLALAQAGGAFGRPARVLAACIVGGLCSGFALLFQLGEHFGGDAQHSANGFALVLTIEFFAAFFGFYLSRGLLRHGG